MEKDLEIYTWDTNSHALHIYNPTLLGSDPILHTEKLNLIKLILYVG